MKNPFKKDVTTKYVVYFNKPKDTKDSEYFSSTLWQATEFASLHNAREFAEGQAKYYECYVAEITPLFKYSNSTTEEAL